MNEIINNYNFGRVDLDIPFYILGILYYIFLQRRVKKDLRKMVSFIRVQLIIKYQKIIPTKIADNFLIGFRL